MIKPYLHRVQYYETDQMGITNNANYVHFMEEARNDYLTQIGFPYAQFEKSGIISPVVRIDCEYKHPTTYPDQIEIKVQIIKLTHFKLRINYRMSVKGILVCKAFSEHCFTKNHHVINLKQQLPRFYRELSRRVASK